MCNIKDKNNFDIEDRLINFAVRIIKVTDSLPKSRTGTHIAKQLVRCGTSPAANYGEAQSAESKPDFLHKMKICLKELRETRVWLKMIIKANLIQPEEALDTLINENEQLVAIFYTSIKTAKAKNENT